MNKKISDQGLVCAMNYLVMSLQVVSPVESLATLRAAGLGLVYMVHTGDVAAQVGGAYGHPTYRARSLAFTIGL